jgi:hypothetical protein
MFSFPSNKLALLKLFEILTQVTTGSTISWDVTPFSQVDF